MQSDYKEICKLTSWRTGEKESTYIDMCRFLFGYTALKMKKPQSLIIRLKGIGMWYIRRKRMMIKIDLFKEFNPELADSLGVNDSELPELIKIFKLRLEDYDRYLELKKQVKDKRNEIAKKESKNNN